MKIFHLTLIAVLMLTPLCDAQAAAATTNASPPKPKSPSPGALKGDEPVDFSSDQGFVDQAHHTLVLTGHVVAEQGPVKLQADAITVHYLEGAGADVTSKGKVESLEANGNVVVTRPGEVVKARAATYKMIEKQILMHGNVIATHGQNVVNAENLVVDLVKEKIELQPGLPGGRVHGIFVPPPEANSQ